MYRFILFYFVLYICINVAPWSCEARHLVPLYVHTCSGLTIKLNLNLNLNTSFVLNYVNAKTFECACCFRNMNMNVLIFCDTQATVRDFRYFNIHKTDTSIKQ